jgi:hypothetical protein
MSLAGEPGQHCLVLGCRRRARLAVGDAAGSVHLNQGQLSGEQGRPDLCEHFRQPGAVLAGDLSGCDGIDELVVGEDLLEQTDYLGLGTGA